jgi:hypothetical protein
MNLLASKKTSLAATGVALRAIRDSADAFPPLKSTAAAMLIVWGAIEKVKSNKKDCRRLAQRATDIVNDIWRQTKDHGVNLPVEAQQSVEEIEKIIRDIVDLMKKLEKQGRFHRYAHQDENKTCIDKAAKLLDEAIQRFDTNMQISILLKQQCAWGALVELDGVSRDRHGEILVASQMTEKERVQLLTEIVHYARFGVFFFDPRLTINDVGQRVFRPPEP